MSYVAQTHLTTGQLVTAAEYNQKIDNIALLKTSIANDGTLAATGGILVAPVINADRNQHIPLSIVAGVLTIDMAVGSYFAVSMTSNITTMTIVNPPASGYTGNFTLRLVGDGTPRTIAWPAAMRAAYNSFPTPTSGLGYVDIYDVTAESTTGFYWLSVRGQGWQGF